MYELCTEAGLAGKKEASDSNVLREPASFIRCIESISDHIFLFLYNLFFVLFCLFILFNIFLFCTILPHFSHHRNHGPKKRNVLLQLWPKTTEGISRSVTQRLQLRLSLARKRNLSSLARLLRLMRLWCRFWKLQHMLHILQWGL